MAEIIVNPDGFGSRQVSTQAGAGNGTGNLVV